MAKAQAKSEVTEPVTSPTEVAEPASPETPASETPTAVDSPATEEAPTPVAEATEDLESAEAEQGLGEQDEPEEEEEEEPRLVEVTNNGKFSLRQPSSGWEIKCGETRELLNDGWLHNQLRSRLFSRT